MENITPKIAVISVSKLNRYIRNMLEDDIILKELFVSGEVSNLKKHVSGHYYFTLKDDKAQISVVMFKNYTHALKFDLKNGMKVTIVGYVSMYEVQGTFQIYAENIFEEGVGTLTKEFEKLKNKLLDKGYFDDNIKKDIPRCVKTVAVLTASDGAAVKDIIKTIRRRNKLIKIIVVPTLVQGAEAKKSIARNIEKINQLSERLNIDVMIVGRGGGSIEDLWAFNEEEVVEAIYKSAVPVISAVGHETDFTLSDFASDARASTPTAAGEMVSIPLDDLKDSLHKHVLNLDRVINNSIRLKKEELKNLTNRNCIRRPELIVYEKQDKLYMTTKDLNYAFDKKIDECSKRFDQRLIKLELLNPIKILNKGYSVTYKHENVVSSSNELEKGDKVKIMFKDGEKNAIID